MMGPLGEVPHHEGETVSDEQPPQPAPESDDPTATEGPEAAGPSAGAGEPPPFVTPATSLGTRPTFDSPPPAIPPPSYTPPSSPPPSSPSPTDAGASWPPADLPPDGPPPPESGRLRIGSVLGRSIDIYLSKWLAFIALALVPAVLSSVVLFLTGFDRIRGIGTVPDQTTIFLWLVIGIGFGLVEIAFSLALIVVADDVRRTGTTDVGAAVRRGVSRLIPTILSFLAIAVAYIAFVIGLA